MSTAATAASSKSVARPSKSKATHAAPPPSEKADHRRKPSPRKSTVAKKSHPVSQAVKRPPVLAVAPPPKKPGVEPARHAKERRHVMSVLVGNDLPSELVRDYPFRATSLEFRRRYDNRVARSYVWVPKSPDTFHELLGVISQSVAFLGFEEVSIASSRSAQYSSIASSADPAEDGLDLKDTRLSLLWIRPPEYTWSQLRNYLVYRQVDSHHVGIINKWLLIANLKDWDQRCEFKTGSGATFASKYFLPETRRLDMPLDEQIHLLESSQGMFIIKPVRGSKGENMILLRLGQRRSVNPDASGGPSQHLLDVLKNAGLRLEQRMSGLILQRYVDRPLLVDKRKFDFRVYMLMVNACRREKSGKVRKAYYVFCHPGFLRLCIMAYQRESKDLLCHLTNQHVQMRSILYDQYKEATVWEPDELNQYFNARSSLPSLNYVRDVVYPKIGTIVGYLGAVFAESLNDSTIQASTFKMFGVDFLVDSALSVQLLEVNELPSWKRQTKVLAGLKTDLWREAVALAVETAVKFRCAEPLEPLIAACNFRLVHSSEDQGLLAGSIAKYFS